MKKRFVEEGFEIGLKGRDSTRCYEKKIEGDFEAHLIALSCGETPEGYARWTLRLLRGVAPPLSFVEWLREKQPRTRSILIWDNAASYHKYGVFRDYLGEQNKGLMEKNGAITCVNSAPNAPQENPVEDTWLQPKTWLRKHAYQYDTFEQLVGEEFFKTRIFNFKKTWLRIFSN